jgi:hypothetical protein
MPDEPKVVNFSEKAEPIRLHLKPFEYKAAEATDGTIIQKKIKKKAEVPDEKKEGTVVEEKKPVQEAQQPQKPVETPPDEIKKPQETPKDEPQYSTPSEKPKPLFVLGKGADKLGPKQLKMIFLTAGLLLAVVAVLMFYLRNRDVTGNLILEEIRKPEITLNASVKFGEVFLSLQNLDGFDWTVCKFSLLGVNSGKIFYQTRSIIKKGISQQFDYAEFYTDQGEKMDPVNEKSIKAKIVCDLDSNIGVWTSDGDF